MAVVSARRVAYDTLRRIERDGAYANLVLGTMLDRSDLSSADRRFATDLVYGTTRMRRACDVLIDRFVASPPDDATRTLLRLGTYQLAFAGVAPHAAVSETVSLAPRRTRGFVNAVLRKVAAGADGAIPWPSEFARLSYPEWMGSRLVDELGEAVGMTADRVREIQRISLDPLSLDSPVGEEDDSYLADFIKDDGAEEPLDAATRQMLQDEVRNVLGELNDREKDVVVMRFGLDDEQPRTLEEVGKHFGVTRERIRQIESKTLAKLRHPHRSQKLREYLEGA